ncbi:hypothetical protein HYS99_00690 [Candidatus Giovannonibacteria bacterium]|nr:hypothetical protein [Candidatus Giovannonibacteria bacterium]
MSDSALRLAKKFIPIRVFKFFQPLYHYLLAFCGAVIYSFPSRGVKVVGVTGTSGKTTTVEFLYAIFSEAGKKTASFSGLQENIMGAKKQNLLKMTMPGRFRMQKFLYDAKKAGCEYVFFEVTSEGIKQYRHRFMKFYAGIFTNLSKEHIEAHGSFENYRAAKGEFFKACPLVILNREDTNFEYFDNISNGKKIYFRRNDLPPGLSLKITGEFNKMNAAAALAFAKHEEISEEGALKTLERINVLPGRMEFVDLRSEERKKFKVVVDYAFIPAVLKKVYETLKKEGESNLICVLGAAGGGRDKWKRPELGNTAAEYCKKVIVTNEDPYDEDPQAIINEIAGQHTFLKILDRRDAIREALKLAEEGDTVVITGKGAEPWIMGPNGTKIKWDDREVVREELEKINSAR